LENHENKQLMIGCCLFLWFSNSLTREARGDGRLSLSGWRTGASRFSDLKRSSSILRFFDSSP
jgi:hypothetical protein